MTHLTPQGRLPDDLPPVGGDRVRELLRTDAFSIEHLVSVDLHAPVQIVEDHEEWFLLLSGGARIEVEGHSRDISQGDWGLLLRKTPHRVLSAEPGTRWLIVRFPAQPREEIVPQYRMSGLASEVLRQAGKQAGTGRSIGPTHLLVGLALVEDGMASQVLRAIGFSVEGAQSAVSIPHPQQSSQTGEILAIAADAARKRGAEVFDTEHLLLALLIHDDNAAANVLMKSGVTIDRVLAQLDQRDS